MPDGRSCAHLTLVHAGVSPLGIPHLERPVLRLRGVDGLKPLVTGVRVPADSEEVDVPVPHPGDLKQRERKNDNSNPDSRLRASRK